MSNNHRSDIDGLRAIAVILVLLFHVGFDFIPGGFVGVDVFFVISGYLITNIIYSDLEQGRFSLQSFYIRRARRILPALLFVCYITLVAGGLLLLPSDFYNLSKSFFAAIFLVSNFFFWRESGGYFSPVAEELPLLHTWSLAIEEQFYLLWPLALIIFVRFVRKGNIVMLVAIVCVLSFIVSEWGVHNKPSFTYFSPFTRGWELLIGGFLAMAGNKNSEIGSIVKNNVISIIGILAILIPPFIISQKTKFPGAHALWPCLGTVMVIYGAKDRRTLINKILSFRPLEVVGLLSYSLYLWSWPLVAFVVYLQYEMTLSIQLSILLITFILSVFSWKYIEVPFRIRNGTANRNIMDKTFASVACISLSVSIGIVYYRMSNLDDGLFIKDAYLNSFQKDKYPECHSVTDPVLPNIKDCTVGRRDDSYEMILWGDSHGVSLMGFFDELGKKSDFSMVSLTFSSCAPLLGISTNKENRSRCLERNAHMKKFVLESDAKHIILAGYWSAYFRKYGPEVVTEGMKSTIDFILDLGKTPIIVDDIPKFSKNVSKVNTKNLMFLSKIVSNKIRLADYLAGNKDVHAAFSDINKEFPKVRFISLRSLFCDKQNCSPEVQGFPIYRDDHHLNLLGSSLLGRLYAVSADSSDVGMSWSEISKLQH